jgi:pyruvate/2-oxoglutarate dehydrogenase complex dihydrolipoamide dehydrogenase (E3) component
MYDYDVVVIGAGSAGLVASKLAAGLGNKTALIERGKIGGDCTWFGCIPSKALIKSAQIAHDLQRMGKFGLATKTQLLLDTGGVMAQVRQVRQDDYETHPPTAFAKERIDLIFAPAKFLDPHRLSLGDRTISAKKMIICTGSRAAIPKIDGLDQIPFLTNETIFELHELPSSMLIIGGGPIGCEMASALNRLGVQITLVQKGPAILPNDDPELTSSLFEFLRTEGIKILTNCALLRFSKERDEISAAIIDEHHAQFTLSAKSVLIAAGRIPNLETLDLARAGIEFDHRGLKVDRHLLTTSPNIYGAGDVVPPYLFTHIAEHEAIVATRNACLPFKITPDYNNILWCTFTAPALAHAGLTEPQAREQFGDKIRIYRWPYSHVDRARTDVAMEGFAKIICDSKGKILGIHILGAEAAELMHEVQLAKSLGRPLSSIAGVIHAYPSYSDAIRQPAKKCYIDRLQNNPFLKLLKKIMPKGKR